MKSLPVMTSILGAALISACGGGGTGSPGSTTGGSPPASASATKIAAELRAAITQARNRFPGSDKQLSQLDLDNDGDEDVVVSLVSTWDENDLSEKRGTVIIRNNGNGEFELEDTDLLTANRYFVTADFNGDGLDDLFFAADHQKHTVDGADLRENRPQLLLQTSSGGLIDASDQIEEIWGDWHGLTAVDYDSDGDQDIIISALNHHEGVYAFKNNGSAIFTIDTASFPSTIVSEYLNGESFFFTNLHTADLTGDGYEELLLGSSADRSFNPETGPGLPILLGNSAGFSFDASTNVTDAYIKNGDQYWGTAVAVGIAIVDFNSDNCFDLAINLTDYNTSKMNTMVGDCEGGFESFKTYVLDGKWMPFMETGDVDNDGLTDVYLYNFYSNANSFVFMNTGEGLQEYTGDRSDLRFSLLGTAALQ